MGSYATTTSFPDLLVNFLKGNTSSSDTAGVAVLTRHINRAEGVVNSYVGARYSLPFTTVPPIIITITEDLTSYYAIRGTHFQDSGDQKNSYVDEFKTSMKMLEEIRDGKVKLALTNGSLVSVATGDRFQSSSENYTPVFGMDDPEDWKRDPDEVEDTSSARE